MTPEKAHAEIRHRYTAGEREIVVDFTTYCAYRDSLIVNERIKDDAVSSERPPWPPRLKFKDATVIAQVTA